MEHRYGIAVLAVGGEIDMVTAPQFEKAIDDVLADDPATLVIDLTEVTFLASVGLRRRAGPYRARSAATRLPDPRRGGGVGVTTTISAPCCTENIRLIREMLETVKRNDLTDDETRGHGRDHQGRSGPEARNSARRGVPRFGAIRQAATALGSHRCHLGPRGIGNFGGI